MNKVKIFFRKLKAKITGKVPCSYESNHGHDLIFPSFHNGEDWASFKCKKCNGILTYFSLMGCFISEDTP